jgi:hypothetical protein
LLQPEFAASGIGGVGQGPVAHRQGQGQRVAAGDQGDFPDDLAGVGTAGGIAIGGELAEVVQLVAVGIGGLRPVRGVGDAEGIDPGVERAAGDHLELDGGGV